MGAMAKCNELSYKLLPKPLYFPYSTPSDYFFCPQWKKMLGGKRFILNNGILAQTKALFEELHKYYYLEGNKKLEKRWPKCMEFKQDHVLVNQRFVFHSKSYGPKSAEQPSIKPSF